MSNENNTVEESYKLTEQDKVDILGAMQEEVSKSENLRVLADLPSNNGMEDHIPEPGQEKEVMVSVDPETGEKRVLGTAIPKEKVSFDDKLSELGESINGSTPVEINKEDVESVITEDSMLGKFPISDEGLLALVNLINLYREKGKITYKDLPEEVQKYVNKYMISNGLGDYSNQANQARNMIANMLMDEYIMQIELNKFTDDFQSQIENIYADTKEELSPLLKQYADNRDEYLAKLTESIEDEDKKELAKKVLDSINDAYTLTRLKEGAKVIKVKNFDLEKPKRAFSSFLAKYTNTASHIYDVFMCTNILHKHLVKNNIIEETDRTFAIKTMVAFAKFCTNYKPEVADQHAFMYYFTNNIVLLDVYSGEQYDNFAPEFLKNIKEFHDLLR